MIKDVVKSAEHMPGSDIYNRYQVQESHLQWDVGDVGGPHLIHRLDLLEIQQAGTPLGLIAWNRGPGFLVDRP